MSGSHLFICTRMIRVDVDGDQVECDMIVYFEVDSFTPGCPATWEQPAEAPEYELSFLSAEFDGGEPDDAPGPLTEAEVAVLKVWFEANYDRACEFADESAADNEYDHADYLYDQRRDERMERKVQ